MAMPLYEGVGAQFYSTSEGYWIDCTVNKVLATGEVQVDCRPDYWMPVSEQQTKLRPASAANEVRPSTAPAGVPGVNSENLTDMPPTVQPGTAVQYYSIALGQWMDATVDFVGMYGEIQVTCSTCSFVVHPSEQAWKLRYPGRAVTFDYPQALGELALSDLAAKDTAALAPGWPFAPSTDNPVAPPEELDAAPPVDPPVLLLQSNASLAQPEAAVDAAALETEEKCEDPSLQESVPAAVCTDVLQTVYRHSIVNAVAPQGAEAIPMVVPTAPSELQNVYRASMSMVTQPVLSEGPDVLKEVYRHSICTVTRPILTEGVLGSVYRKSICLADHQTNQAPKEPPPMAPKGSTPKGKVGIGGTEIRTFKK